MAKTITEALAELKTLEKRLVKKQEAIVTYLVRQEAMRDPHQASGGSEKLVREEMQAFDDLCARVIVIRAAIARANATEKCRVLDTERTVGDWLVWRREVAPKLQALFASMRQRIESVRTEAHRKGFSVVPAGEGKGLTDVLVNTDEKRLVALAENVESMLGELDGKLSLKNATVLVEV